MFTVTSCSPIKWPLNGNVNCPPGEFLYGTTCNVTCQKGYEMVPMTNDGIQSITCNANGHKNSLPNICQRKLSSLSVISALHYLQF